PRPITIRDKDFDMVRVRAFGMFSYRVADPRLFFKEVSGTREVYTRDEVEEQLRGILMATMASSLGGAQVPFLDMAYQGFGDGIHEDAAAVRLFAESGLTFFVSSSFSKSFS
ncbi:aminotransferase class I/II-fold pyridoxal phosphate-dependent enzyme, partial [Pseudomonas viridiflava]|uniref:aminotransferase class I/II-fold pyridoxal phosphate-dependent enzyme n=1 Tax=Pseudomonas viridiflava TaxID=33069 RepID=UPI001F15632C